MSTQEVLTTVEKDGDALEVIVQQGTNRQQPKSIDEMLAKQVPTALRYDNAAF